MIGVLKWSFAVFMGSVLALLLTPQPHYVSETYEFNVEREIFFNYITNPENFKQINPTILDLEVVKYNKETIEVIYTEFLVQLPFLTNFANVIYNIKKNGDIWTMHSIHSTCFLTKLACLSTESTISARDVGYKIINYTEEITYYCPRVLSTFCSKEVSLQRALIINSLKAIFSDN